MLSPAAADTAISKVSPAFNEPERMAAPRALTTGIGSPVNANSSIGRRVRADDAVDRNDFARPHQKPVADGDGRYRHVLDAVVDAAMGLARRAIDQRAQIMLGAGNGDILEHIAAGIHQRDDGAGERLAERQRRAHRHQRDRIDAEPAGQKIPHDRDRQSRHHRRGRQRPAEIGEIRPAGGVGGNTRRQSRNGDRDECPPQDALK